MHEKYMTALRCGDMSVGCVDLLCELMQHDTRNHSSSKFKAQAGRVQNIS